MLPHVKRLQLLFVSCYGCDPILIMSSWRGGTVGIGMLADTSIMKECDGMCLCHLTDTANLDELSPPKSWGYCPAVSGLWEPLIPSVPAAASDTQLDKQLNIPLRCCRPWRLLVLPLIWPQNCRDIIGNLISTGLEINLSVTVVRARLPGSKNWEGAAAPTVPRLLHHFASLNLLFSLHL